MVLDRSIRRDEFLRGGITLNQKNKIRDILFFNEKLDVYKDGVVRASCAENRPTHRAYPMQCAQFFFNPASWDYSLLLTNVQEKTLFGDHLTIERVVNTIVPREHLRDLPIPSAKKTKWYSTLKEEGFTIKKGYVFAPNSNLSLGFMSSPYSFRPVGIDKSSLRNAHIKLGGIYKTVMETT